MDNLEIQSIIDTIDNLIEPLRKELDKELAKISI